MSGPGAHGNTAGPAAILPIVARDVCVRRGGRELLNHIDLVLPCDGAITVLLGPNGAGKSLLVRVLANLIEPDSGSVHWAGAAPALARAPALGMVFQRPVLLNRTVADNLSFALAAIKVAHDERDERIQAALTMAKLSHIAHQPAKLLSGGEQQRLALARAIACRPQLLILDEPTAHLDPAATAAIETVLLRVRAERTPILFITHDLAQAKRLADRMIFMHKGEIVESADAAEFFANPGSEAARTFLGGGLLV